MHPEAVPDSRLAADSIFLQAGGGVLDSDVLSGARDALQLSSALQRHLWHIYKDLAKTYHWDDANDLRQFLLHTQGETESRILSCEHALQNHVNISFDTFANITTSAYGTAVKPTVEQDYSLPLSNYFVSSSHNTYLIGHQLYGDARVDGYKNVMYIN